MKDIADYKDNKISLEEIQSFFHIDAYNELYQVVVTLINDGKISAIKSSKANGKTPPLYRSYRIIREKVDYSQFKEELLYDLVPMLKNDYYLKNMENYSRDRKRILMLNHFLKHQEDNLKYETSYNERSFEIWGREKFLAREGGLKLLKNLELPLEYLNVYETTEPLAYYSQHKGVPQKVLILENKDTFYSMRRHLIAGNPTILGVEIATLIYGGGKSIYKSFQDFTLCVEPYLTDKQNEILYFGDLDYEGILIFETLQSNFRDQVIVKPFLEAYEKMLTKADFSTLPLMKEGQNNHIGTSFLGFFDREVQEMITLLLHKNTYIPQEILQTKDF